MSACHNVSWLLCVSRKPWEPQLSGVREVCARVPVYVPVRCESWRASSVCTCVPPCPCMGRCPQQPLSACVGSQLEPTRSRPLCAGRGVGMGHACTSVPAGKLWEATRCPVARQEEEKAAGARIGAAECLRGV